MPKGYVEVLLSNSLLTSNTGWSNTNSSKFDLNARYTYDFVTAIANLGVSKSNQFNAGIEIHYAIGYHDSDSKSSPMAIFQSSPPGIVQRSSALTSIGPRIKWRPFKHNFHFVYISTLQLPVLSNSYAESLLGQSRVQWGNQFLYSFSAGKRIIFFAQDDLYVYFKQGIDSHNQYYEGLTLYSYFLITKHLFPFVSTGYAGSFGTDVSSNFRNLYHALPAGAGLQYQFSLRFTFNVYYNQYVWAKNYNDWKTFNLGLRAVF